MSKIHRIVLFFILVLMQVMFYACEDAGERELHTDTAITSVYIRNKVGGVSVEGVSQADDASKIIFEIPLAYQDELDISFIMIYGNIPVSASVSPGFAGRHDLSSPKQFVVTNDDNIPRTYTLQAINLDY